MAIYRLDQDATDAWDAWQEAKREANEAAKRAERAKQVFVAAFGDRERAALADGRIVRRIREQRNGYQVPPKVIERYIIEAG